MYRQNTVLNDFVNFLKARGRFREIEFIDNSVHATPRIPDFPKLVFYIEEARSEQLYTLEIHGEESTVMNSEIQEFFNLNQLGLKKIKVKYFLTTDNNDTLIIEADGIGIPFETLIERTTTLFETHQYIITKTQKTLVFSSEVSKAKPQQTIKPVSRLQEAPRTLDPKIQTPISSNIYDRVTPQREQLPSRQRTTPSTEYQTQPKEIRSPQKTKIPVMKKKIPKPSVDVKLKTPDQIISPIDNDIIDLKEKSPSKPPKEEYQSKEKLQDAKIPIEDFEKDLFHPKPPSKTYSSDIEPYLKQTTSLFRRDNWEEDLPSEFEMEILERTYMRIKHRTKPEILAKDLNVSIEEAENHLRSLILKGLLRTQVGWFIIKKSHLPFFKKNFSDGEKKKKKKKSPRISRVGEGLTTEEIATIKAIKSRPNLKAQSNLLTRPTGLKQSILKEVLRNLVEKGILRVSYGWYILKDKNILEHKRGTSLAKAKDPQQYEIPKELALSPSEEKVIQALLQRPHYKAQSNLLAPDLKLPKEQIKQVLRELVEKNICKVQFGWYCLKNPERFQSS